MIVGSLCFRLSFICFLGFEASGEGTESSCKVEQGRIKQLEGQVLNLENELAALKIEHSVGQRISLTKFGLQCASLSNDVIHHLLQATDLDEQFFHHASNVAVTARDRALTLKNNFVTKISEVNYTQYRHTIQSSEGFQALMKKTEPFVDQAKPMLDKARDVCKPMLQTVEPVFAQAKGICQPVVQKAFEKCSSAFSSVEKQVMPALRKGGAHVLDSTFGPGSTLDRIVAPLFEKAGRIAPQHLDTLPQHPFDRLLFVMAFVLFTYYALYAALICLRMILKFLKKTTWASFIVFKLLVMIPLKCLKRMISCIFWLATGFYCCGLCSKRKTSQEKKTTKEQNSGSSLSATEVEKALKSLPGDKQDKLVKALADHAKSGKPLDKKFGVVAAGKVVTKESLSQACKKLGIKSGF